MSPGLQLKISPKCDTAAIKLEFYVFWQTNVFYAVKIIQLVNVKFFSWRQSQCLLFKWSIIILIMVSLSQPYNQA